MPEIRDTYTLDVSQAVSGLDKATRAAERHQNQMERMAHTSESVFGRLGAKIRDTATNAFDAWRDRANSIIYVKNETGEYERNLKGLIGTTREFGQATKEVHNPLDGIVHKLGRMAVYFFSIRRLVRYTINAIKQAPDEVAEPFSRFKDSISGGFTRSIVSMMDGMTESVKRLNAVFASSSGQKFARGMEAVFRGLGAALGFVIDKFAVLVDFVGNNFEPIMTGAILVVGFFASKMLLAAAAGLVAHWRMLLLVSVITALITGLNSAGITADKVFRWIGTGAGWLYAFTHNLVAGAFNLFATFAEFVANAFLSVEGSVERAVTRGLDTLLAFAEGVARILDKLSGDDLAGAIASKRAEMKATVEAKYQDAGVQFGRMEMLDYSDTGKAWGDAFSRFGTSLSDFSLKNAVAQPIKSLDSIDGNVASIKKAVNMAEEDIKALVDVAERRFVNQVNLTSQSPVINVQGQNTGNSEQDRQALADALAAVLLEQFDSGSSYTTAFTF